MGWADCGDDSRGRRIGYAWAARCDHVWAGKKCNARIDRGLAYACGGMHGSDEYSCEGYFCPKHLYISSNIEAPAQLCRRCCLRADLAARPLGKEKAE